MTEYAYDEPEAVEVDPDIWQEMNEWAIEHQQARDAELDQQFSESEQRWAEEDRQREAEEAEAAELEDTYNALLLRHVEACKEAGVEDEQTMLEAFQLAEGVASDKEFARRYRDGSELVTAALAEGIRLAGPAKGEDEIRAAERIMARRSAERRYIESAAGVPDRSHEKRLLEAGSELMGLTKAQKAEVREAVGLPEES